MGVHVQPIYLFVFFVLSFYPSLAKANFALSLAQSQWKQIEETDSYLQTPVCRAFTQASTSAEPVEFSLAYPKDGKILPMVALRTKLAPALIAIKINRKETEYLVPLAAGATNQDPNLFWYAPVNFSRLEKLVREQNTLDLILDPKGAATPIQVSLAGSSNALDAAKKCVKATAFPADFFKLLNAEKDNLNPDLGDRSGAFLFQAVQNAYNAYLAGQSINVEIQALRKTVAPILAKEKSALEKRSSANSVYVKAQKKLTDANNLVESLTNKLNEAKATLASLQAQKPVAEADLAQKKAIYFPLKEKMAPYEKSVADAARTVEGIESDIQENEELIVTNTRRIPELERERQELIREIPGMEDDVARARRAFNDADDAYRRYDVRREADNILNSGFTYRWALNDRDSARRDLDNARNDYFRLQGQVNSAQIALSTCRANPQADCSSQQAAYDSANRDLQQAQWNQSNLESRLRDLEYKIASLENDANNQAQAESDRLRRVRDDADSRYARARRDLNDAQDRIVEIPRLIPVLRQQIADAQAALPGLRNNLAAAQAALAQKTAERNRFAEEIGFEAAKANYLAADKLFGEIVAGIAARTKEIPQITKQLTQAQKAVPPLAKSFESAKAALAAADAKLAPIQEQLQPFRAQEAVKLAALEAESVKFKTARAAFHDLLDELVGRQ